MLSAAFYDWGGGANDPDFSVDFTRSTATFRTPEILYNNPQKLLYLSWWSW